MSQTTFSGPVASLAGFDFPVVTTANLPAPTSVSPGVCYVISDNGVGNNEYCLVINTGSAWVTAVGAALS
ncbi:hypothetical protein UFOVP126_14 [uncultured Caudovirales phage]|uniref:Uncharacterized protein n=1 Tax=uncultured Caudovirales phage TaxID=2100421 RepID=A0A6J5LCT9_9CAUD|nr:hypothetical protein UFOVP126_14 [uncultured Caudovirales phage]